MNAQSLVGQDECVKAIQTYFDKCKRERESGMKRTNDRHMFNEFRITYTHLKHSGRERRHFVHYIRDLGVWHRIERRYRSVYNVNILSALRNPFYIL